MKKYEFIKKDIDTFILKYKDKEKEFKATVGVASRIQKNQEKAEARMILDLAKQGMTVNDLKIEKRENGKKYVDESNYNAVREIYRNESLNDVFDEICEELFDYKLADLILEIGIESADEGIVFATQLMNCLTGGSVEEEQITTPSQETQTSN